MKKKINFDDFSEHELIDLRVSLEFEFRQRGIKFSVGEIGENLAVNYFNKTPGLPNLQKAPAGVKNVDALSRDGHRYSIKTVQTAKKTGTIYPDGVKPDLQLFEYLIVIKLSHDYNMKTLFRFSWEQFLKQRAWDKRMNAWYVPLSSNRLKNAEKLFEIE